MRLTNILRVFSAESLGLALILSTVACNQEPSEARVPALLDTGGDNPSNDDEVGDDGDGDGDDEPGDGDGEPGDGDGEPGDGDGEPGDGDGDGDGDVCPLGSADCPCDNGACDGKLECVDDTCRYPLGPFEYCGWYPDNGWYVCGLPFENPDVPISCGDLVLEVDAECPEGLDEVGCCDNDGNNWWCEDDKTAFENCAPGDGDGDPGDGDGDPGDGDGDPGDGDGDGDGDA